MKYFPVFLNLHGKKVVVIGGGGVAERKVRTLVKAGAIVKLVSPDIANALEKLKKRGLLIHIKRQYKKGDLKNAFLVIAGTSSVRINQKIAQDAKHLINVIDNPSEGNFIAPSLVKRGPLTIAISSEGTSPAAAKFIRKEIESIYGKEFIQYLKFLGTMRTSALNEIKDNKKRKKFLKSLASKKIFDTVRKKNISSLRKQIKKEFLEMAVS